MPELPDVELYLARLRERIQGAPLDAMRVYSPFVLRSVDPPVPEFVGRTVIGVGRLGKRILLRFEGDLFCMIHLMIAGRFAWGPAKDSRATGKTLLADWRFPSGRLSLLEFSKQKRAAITLVRGADKLRVYDRGGLDTTTASPQQFYERLQSQNRTLKRALTDPAMFDGIGNAYSDEILWEARLSPMKLTRSLDADASTDLLGACQKTLRHWRDELQRIYPDFPRPSDVTAFRDGFATHGRYEMPCPRCASPIQRIVTGDNETNYCATCQTEGRLLADRALSRLLKADWPKTLDAMATE